MLIPTRDHRDRRTDSRLQLRSYRRPGIALFADGHPPDASPVFPRAPSRARARARRSREAARRSGASPSAVIRCAAASSACKLVRWVLFFDEMVNTFDPDALIVGGGAIETTDAFQRWFVDEIRARHARTAGGTGRHSDSYHAERGHGRVARGGDRGARLRAEDEPRLAARQAMSALPESRGRLILKLHPIGRPSTPFASNGVLKPYLESITEPFYHLDEHWRFVFANQPAVDYLGRSREALIGLGSVWEVFPRRQARSSPLVQASG